MGKRKWQENIICDNCGYQNKDYWVKRSGICNGCGKVLDPKAKFKDDMRIKLHLIRGSKWQI